MILRSKTSPVAHQERSENTFLLRSGDNVQIPRRRGFGRCSNIGPIFIFHCSTGVQRSAIVLKLNWWVDKNKILFLRRHKHNTHQMNLAKSYTNTSSTSPYLTSNPQDQNRPTKLVQHYGGDHLRKWRMVALLPRDDDKSIAIADDLSYRPLIVPWQEMGVKAIGTAAEQGRWYRGGRCRLSCSYLIFNE